MLNLREEIQCAINRHSAENTSNTPDFILANYLIDCLTAFDAAVSHREAWYGKQTDKVIQQSDDTAGGESWNGFIS